MCVREWSLCLSWKVKKKILVMTLFSTVNYAFLFEAYLIERFLFFEHG